MRKYKCPLCGSENIYFYQEVISTLTYRILGVKKDGQPRVSKKPIGGKWAYFNTSDGSMPYGLRCLDCWNIHSILMDSNVSEWLIEEGTNHEKK